MQRNFKYCPKKLKPAFELFLAKGVRNKITRTMRSKKIEICQLDSCR